VNVDQTVRGCIAVVEAMQSRASQRLPSVLF
jgi:hypothetical protein